MPNENVVNPSNGLLAQHQRLFHPQAIQEALEQSIRAALKQFTDAIRARYHIEAWFNSLTEHSEKDIQELNEVILAEENAYNTWKIQFPAVSELYHTLSVAIKNRELCIFTKTCRELALEAIHIHTKVLSELYHPSDNHMAIMQQFTDYCIDAKNRAEKEGDNDNYIRNIQILTALATIKNNVVKSTEKNNYILALKNHLYSKINRNITLLTRYDVTLNLTPHTTIIESKLFVDLMLFTFGISNNPELKKCAELINNLKRGNINIKALQHLVQETILKRNEAYKNDNQIAVQNYVMLMCALQGLINQYSAHRLINYQEHHKNADLKTAVTLICQYYQVPNYQAYESALQLQTDNDKLIFQREEQLDKEINSLEVEIITEVKTLWSQNINHFTGPDMIPGAA